VDKKLVTSLASSLVRARGRSLAIAGGSASASGNDTLEAAVFLINHSLGNYGSALFEERAARTAGGISGLARLVRDMQDGRVKTLVVAGANPVYDAPIPFADAMEKVDLVVSLADRIDETAALADYLAPASHALEAWGDVDLGGGVTAVQQPVIRPLHDTRGFFDILLTWAKGAGAAIKSAAGMAGPGHSYLQNHWVSRVLPSAASWADVLGSGFLVGGVAATTGGAADAAAADEKAVDEVDEEKERGKKRKGGKKKGAKKRLTAKEKLAAKEKEAGTEESAEERALRLPVAVVAALGGPVAASGELELQLYPHFALHDGRSANNGWLHELPDPITRITWGSAVSVAPRRFDEMGLKNGDLVEVGVAGITRVLPAYRHAGLHQDQIAMPLGFGREACGKIGNGVGSNCFGLQQVRGDQLVRAGLAATLTKRSGHEELAFGQGGDVVDRPRRPVVPLTTLSSYKRNPSSGTEQFPGGKSAWPEHPYPNQRWGMTIDLSKCNGCGKCSLACQAENNIPVVGRQGILDGREMAWMRIDRYYDAPPKEGGWGDDVYDAPLEVVEDPVTVFEPMLCQHCENAPCETVCPFNATMHSEDGINQQVYNRCVGTRYCANNCPFKVRRYNWYEYSHRRDAALLNLLFPIMGRHADLNTRGRMQMKNNPEVTVRSRGVMEKCTFCVQRIREARAEAIRAGADKDALPDGAVVPACMEACPTGAIVFGDINDPGSRVSAVRKDPRAMRLLESIGVKPVVSYLTKVRNDNA
jgi:molybdopterin-containing oxidoreductase family iron-sulfur binding subunit